MKILFVLQSLKKAGAEKLVINICNELIISENHEVAIFLFNPINDFKTELDSRVILAGGDAYLRFSLYRKNQVKNGSYIQFVKNFKPDIIHSHLYHADLLAHSFYSENAAYISHLHNSIIEGYDGFIVKDFFKKRMWANFYEYIWIMKRFRKFKTNFIACSKGAFRLHQNRIRLGNIIVLPNASPITNKNIIYKDIGGPLNLVWAGRLTNVKRPQLAIKVVSVLKERGVSCNLKILGEGDEMEACKELINKLNLNNEVEMTGFVNNPVAFLKEAHLLLHTASYEGLPMIFMEANSWCIPIVSTDCMPENEYIKNGSNGIIAGTANPQSLADEIIKIKETPAIFKEMSKNSYLQAIKFDIKQYVEKLENFYGYIKK